VARPMEPPSRTSLGASSTRPMSRTCGRDRVRVDIDAAEAVAGNFAGERKRAVRRTPDSTMSATPKRALERAEVF